MQRRTGFLTTAALVVAASLLLALGATDATATHVSALSTGGEQMLCYDCHNLSGDANFGYEPGTNYINRNIRTLSTMKILNGGPAPGVFGCTFCHNDATRTAKMKDALGDFATQASMHYVGKTRADLQTWNEYVSNRTGNAWNATPIANELQCTYCHDTALVDYPDSTAGYNDHAAAVATNPNRVRGFNNTAAYPYNESCVNTCHDGDYEAGTAIAPVAPVNLPNGEAVPRMGHYGWGSYVGGAAPSLREPRGDNILQVRCQVCHDTHSSNQDRLFSDGTEDTKIEVNNCTAVCHLGGAVGSSYRTKGHGKPLNRELTVAIGFSYTTCAPCHNSGVPHRDPANPQRFGLTNDVNQADIAYNGLADGLDNNMNGQVDEAAEAAWTNSATSICRTCHSTYNVHSGSVITPTGRSASCLDCHDPHGPAVGGNIEMIRSTILGEPTTYVAPPESPAPDFFRSGDATGACDNVACHGKALGNDTTAGTILGDVSAHQGVGPGTNCISCHVHSSQSGAASFAPNCDVCHGYPPTLADTLADNTNAVGVHQRHVTGLGQSCSECHFNTGNQHNESLWTSYPGYPVPTANVDVVFSTHGGTVNTVASYDAASHTCANVTCHNPDSNVVGKGLTGKGAADTFNNPQWLAGYTPIATCTACHVQSPATNPDGGSHYRHDNAAQRNYPCEYCHSGYANQVTHANLSLTTTNVVVLAGTLGAVSMGGTYTDATRICAGVYCHGTTLGAAGSNTAPTWGTAATGTCGTCHDNDTADTTPATRIATGNHATHVNPTAAPYGPRAACTDCHAPTTSALHVNGIKDFADGNPLSAPATNACDGCHSGSPTTAKSEWALAAGHWRTVTGGYCEHCHDATPSTVNTAAGTGGVPAVAPDKSTYFLTTGHGTTAGFNATLHGQPGPGYVCTRCHTTASAHIDGTAGNTDRLVAGPTDALAYTSAGSEFCLDCHRVGQTANGSLGANAVAEATVHSGGVTGRYNTAAATAAFPRYGEAPYATNQGYQCNACHDPHGTTKLAMVKPTIAGGSTWVTTTITGFGVALTNLQGLDPTTAAGDGVCDACHAAAGPAHPDTAPSAVGPNGNHNQGDTGAACMKCHSHAVSFEGGCTNCHGNNTAKTIWPDAIAGNNPPATRVLYADDAAGAHADHIAALQAKEGFTLSIADQKAMCAYCHPNPGAAGHDQNLGTPSQVDVDPLAFKRIDGVSNKVGTADGNLLASYSTAAKTCSNVDCHYETTTAGWESGTAATCATCHAWQPYDAAAAGSLPNAHDLHVDEIADGGYNMNGSGFGCFKCHPETASTSHLTGRAEVSFTSAFPPWGNDGDETATGAGGAVKYGSGAVTDYYTCNGISCHGDYTGGNTTNAPNWFNTDAALGPTNGDGKCGSCHGTVASKDPQPVYPDGTPKANKHPVHHTTSNYGCQVCHYPTTTTGTSITGRLVHANGTIDADDDGAGATLDSFTYAVAGGTCTVTACHGGGTVTWGGGTQIACNICHGQSGGVVTNTDVNSFTWDNTTQSKIADNEYLSVGHGDSAPRAINKACSACHDSSVPHDITPTLTGANPWRLRDLELGTAGLQFSCSSTTAGCHVAGISGPQTGLPLTAIVTHSNEEMIAALGSPKRNWPVGWDPQCLNCHDPHGDGANHSMVQREIYDKAAFNLPSGVPAAPTEQTALVFSDNTTGANAGGTSYANLNAPFSSLCQECHEDASMVSFRDNTSASAANHPVSGGNPGDCSNCHKHDSAFKPSGCNGCHGSIAAKSYWPDQIAYPDTAGAHLNHVNTVGVWLYGETDATGLLVDNGNGTSDTKQKAICAWCHPNPGDPRAGTGEGSHDGGGTPADVHGDGRLPSAVSYQQYTGLAAPAAVNDTDATYTAATHSCGLTNCHNQVATPDWNVAAPWTTTSCATIQCHNPAAASGRHLTHYGPAAKNYNCNQCHVVPASLRHLNGQVNLAWTAGLENDGDGFYDHDGTTTPTAGDNNFAPLYDGGVANPTCYNMYCHGDFAGGNAANTATWSGLAACGTCHGGTTATTTSGSHTTHFNTVFGANVASCLVCHTNYTLATATHVDGVNTVVASGVSAAASTLAATAVCNGCHGILTYDTEVIKANWPDANANTYTAGSANSDVTCESCHGGGDTPARQNADGTGGAAPAKTANYVTRGHGLPVGSTYAPSGRTGAGAFCVTCHNGASAHISATAGDTDRLATPGNALCTNCHDGTADGAGNKSAVRVSTHANTSATMTALSAIDRYTAQRAPFELNCAECHDVHGTTNIYMVTPSNPNGPLVAPRLYNGAANTTNYLYNSGAVAFTANAAGADFATTAANATKICQTCHTTTGGATAVYRHNAATTGHDTAACAQCHAHDIDDNWGAPATSQDGFMPRRNCMNCHNGSTSGPNVMTYWFGSNATKQDGGHGDPEGRDSGLNGPAPVCADCHDPSLPAGTHLDGTYNSLWNDTTRNANTSHLKGEYFSRTPPPSNPIGAGTWSVQVTFDNYCAEKCHPGKGVPAMTHERDTAALDNNHWSVELGTHLTVADGNAVPYPVDEDLNVGAGLAVPDYVTCITCHDPHGTGISEPSKTSNRMVRDQWIATPTLCNNCHL